MKNQIDALVDGRAIHKRKRKRCISMWMYDHELDALKIHAAKANASVSELVRAIVCESLYDIDAMCKMIDEARGWDEREGENDDERTQEAYP